MVVTTNPVLQQVLHRRRMLRYARWSAAAWVFFGSLHIALWWLAFDYRFAGLPQDLLSAFVWPVLFLATASFISLVVFAARWFLTPDEAPVAQPATDGLEVGTPEPAAAGR